MEESNKSSTKSDEEHALISQLAAVLSNSPSSPPNSASLKTVDLLNVNSTNQGTDSTSGLVSDQHAGRSSFDYDPSEEYYETQKRLFVQLQEKNVELRRMIARMKSGSPGVNGVSRVGTLNKINIDTEEKQQQPQVHETNDVITDSNVNDQSNQPLQSEIQALKEYNAELNPKLMELQEKRAYLTQRLEELLSVVQEGRSSEPTSPALHIA